MRVIATAGHVDHGKSSLVLALTGTDPDRFEEEKRRGLTIDLGFAHTVLPGGEGVSFIDVPGHVRFLRNMLAGVGGVDACMFVVAATEGWKPQSEEHLRILELLGIRRGIVALTKVDLVDDDLLELATLDVSEHVVGTFLDGAPIVPVAANAGVGLDNLRAELATLVATTPGAADRRRARLWVDRVFAAKGSGTVVTGTLTGGALATGERIVVGPEGLAGRIRSIQTLGATVDTIGPGNRVALNLGGVEHTAVGRGDAVVHPDRWFMTSRFDASLTVLDHVDHEVSRRGAYAVYLGSGEFPARLRILGTEAIGPGGIGSIRLHLQRTVPLLPGDRFVLREAGRNETIGGGEVLDVAPIRPASRAAPDRDIDRLVAEHGWIDAARLELLTGELVAPTLGPWVVAPGLIEKVADTVRAAVASGGPLGLDVAGFDERERAVLATLPGVRVDAGRAFPAEVRDEFADHPALEILRLGGLAPGPIEGVEPRLIREFVRRKLVVERDGVAFHPDAIETAAGVARDLLAARPEGFTVADFRDAIAGTRKHVLPLLGELDARGVTRRRDDLRIAGPRLPA